MIFTYPAAVSDNVDKRYLPQIIKTLELYLLHHIAEAAASGTLRFKMVQRYPGGPLSNIMLENEFIPDLEELDKILLNEHGASNVGYDNDYDNDDYGNGNDRDKRKPEYSTEFKNVSGSVSSYFSDSTRSERFTNDKIKDRLDKIDQLLGDTYRLKGSSSNPEEYNDIDQMIKNLESEKANLVKLYDLKKADVIKGGVGLSDLRIDTTTTYDLRPTSITVRALVTTKKWKLGFIPTRRATSDPKEMSIPLSVKVIPVTVKDFGNMQNLLINDAFKSTFAKVYTSFIRNVSSRFFGLFKPVVNRVLGKNFNVWRDILLNRKGVFNAGSFTGSIGSPSFSKLAATIVILSSNDIKKSMSGVLTNPNIMSKLFLMGWNTIAVADDSSKNLLLFAQFDSGYAKEIPYSYLFKSSATYDLFKDLDDLSRFTNRFNRNVAPSASIIKKLNESFKPLKQKVLITELTENEIIERESDKRVQYLLDKFKN